MADEIEKDEVEVIDKDKEESEVEDDKEREIEKEKDEGKEEEEIDVDKIEPEVRNKPVEKKEVVDDDDEVDPDDEARINKIVDKKIGGKVAEMENKMEVQSFVAAKPEYAKYQDVILKYISHPAYSNIPVSNIAAMVASKDMQKLGAAKEREAQKKIAETKSPGGTIRKQDGGKVDWSTATEEDYNAQRAKVLGH